MPVIPGSAAPARQDPLRLLAGVAAVLAATAPTLLAYNLPPSATLLNQCLAVTLWGWFAALAAVPIDAAAWRRSASAWLALAVVGLSVAASGLVGALPSSLMLSALGLVAGAMLLCALGAALARHEAGTVVMAYVHFGLVLAGVLSALVALVQVFAPGLADGELIARSGLAGRAVGNLRQPNHLSSLLLMAVAAAMALLAQGRLHRAMVAGVVALLIAGVVLSGSRTGALSTLLLAAWGALDRRQSRFARGLLLATPLLYGGFWLADSLWSQAMHQVSAVDMGVGTQRGDISSSRFGIWKNTLALIAAQPWLGVGFGEFNLAWSLTPFPGRPTALFDHTHNLPLQLAVELGVPLALLVTGLLALALWRAGQRAFASEGDRGHGARAGFAIVALMALHSQLEYPLWYAYFLLPTALVMGHALGVGDEAPASPARPGPGPAPAVVLAGAAMAVAGALAVFDYMSVVVIFAPPERAASLEERIARGQRSVLFAHHADYAAATTGLPEDPASQALAWRRAPHHLLDARLMMAWVRALDEAGQADRARHVAARLREFNKPEADEFFAVCTREAAVDVQCQPPRQAHGWREFLAR